MNFMDKYIKLLQIADDWLEGFIELSGEDQSVADYINEIQVAYNFVKRALKTQDANDIYRALRKFHWILVSESEDEDEEAYADLANKVKQAIEDLGDSGYVKKLDENVFMKKSELKKLTKMVLREISQNSDSSQEHPLERLFKKLTQRVVQNHPEFSDISKGHQLAHRMVKAMITDIKSMITSSLRNNKDEFSKGIEAFEAHSSSLMDFIIGWAQQIHAEHPETDEQIDRVMHELKVHITQVGAQFKEAFVNLRQKNNLGKKNIINSAKQLEHLNEIFNQLKESIDTLFQIGLSVGYGKKK